MGPRPRDANRDKATLRISEHLIKRRHQLGLLNRIKENPELLKSSILPSIRPTIGKVFHHKDINQKAHRILHHTRIQILNECAIPEACRDSNILQLRINKALDRHNDRERICKVIEEQREKLDRSNLKRLDKKVRFHLDRKQSSTKQPSPNINRNVKRKRTAKRRAAERKRYRKARHAKKVDWMKQHVEQNIKGKLVINLSSVAVPDIAFMYLSKGLNFVENKSVPKEDTLFDTKEFLRKMEWRAYYHQKLSESDQDTNTEKIDIHKDLRIRSRNHPLDFKHPLFEEIKTKVMGFVTNQEPSKPKSNLTDAEQRGKGWLLDSIRQQKVFITSADKGGATLIMDYGTVMKSVESELEKESKFTKLEQNVDIKMEQTQQKVKNAVLKHHNLNTITEEDKKRITGINAKGNMIHAPELRPSVPYAYPLYKVHKLSQEQLERKTVPPTRLVHATKGGPLYDLRSMSVLTSPN